jgi:hypothetical protein
MESTEVIREERAGIERQITKARGFRDAQRDGSAHYELFQNRIDTLTTLLLWCDEVIPKLAVLDEQERVARQALNDASSQLWYADTVEQSRVRQARRGAAVAAVFGVLMVLVGGLGSPPWWVLASGIMALICAVGLFGWSVWWMSESAQDCQAAQSAAQDVIDGITAHRSTLLRGRVATEQSDPVASAQDIPEDQRTLALNPGGSNSAS